MRFNRESRSFALAQIVALTLAIPVSAAPSVAHADPGLEGATVFLDPGHNGVNDSSISQQVPNGRGGTKECQTSGTSTNSGYPEHAFNWDIAMRVSAALSAEGVRTQMSRSSDDGNGPCVDARAAAANAMQPDAIVSIHADGGPADGQGFHVIYSSPPLNDAQSASVGFAQVMRDSFLAEGFTESTYAGSGGLMGRSDLAGLNFYEYPGILVELGNMRNADEAARMENPEGRAAYANAIVEGIVAYLRQ
jgi:N-acetylmuramoyl-L-alanine amidase